jgi:hypothetical protein
MANPKLSSKLDWPLANPLWAASINPLIENPMNNGILITGLVLASGANIINHKLGRAPQGWIIVDIQGIASIYRSAPFNSTTLTLFSSADITISLGVF